MRDTEIPAQEERHHSKQGSTAVYAVGKDRQAPWISVGTQLPQDTLHTDEALSYSGLAGWGLERRPLSFVGNRDGYGNTPMVEVRSRVAVVRKDTGACVGVVSPSYRLVPNEEAFDWADALLGGAGYHYVAAGSLRHGAFVWMLAQAPKAIELPDSSVDMFLLLANSHDGSSAVTAAITPLRMRCTNVLRSALGSARHAYRIKHTKNAEQKLAEAQAVLGLAQAAADRLEATAAALFARKLSEKAFDDFLGTLIATPDNAAAAARADETRATIRSIYTQAEDQAPIVGTAWGAYNAVAAYVDHGTTDRTTKKHSAAENGFKRSMISDNLGDRALAILEPALARR